MTTKELNEILNYSPALLLDYDSIVKLIQEGYSDDLTEEDCECLAERFKARATELRNHIQEQR